MARVPEVMAERTPALDDFRHCGFDCGTGDPASRLLRVAPYTVRFVRELRQLEPIPP
jgi:hypothetical protein